MTDETAMRRLKGAFNPSNFSGSWVQDFLGGNLLQVCKEIVSGESVQCLSSDTVHVDPSATQDMLLDYVPVTADGNPLFGDATGVVATHYFITRPTVVRTVFKMAGLNPEEPSASAMLILWNFIASQTRNLVRRKSQGCLVNFMFSTLSDFGVNPSVVHAELLKCMGTCEACGLKGPAVIRHADLCCAATLSSWRVLNAAQADTAPNQLASLVAKTVLTGAKW